jgi:lipoprotein-anchoring transpeptidase ErfK/SrfK
VLLGLAILVPIVPIVIGLVLGSASADANDGGPISPTNPPQALTFTPLGLVASVPGLATLPPGAGALVAEVVTPTTMRTSPHGRPLTRIGTRSTFGSPTVVLVARHAHGWLGVISAQSGNGRIGWIPLADVSLSRVTYEIKVSVSTRRLTVLDRGKLIKTYAVAVGRPTAPTPTGRFEVTDRLATGDPSGPYGCCIIALSAQAPHAIQGWGGGNRIAIHSTPETWTIGHPVSHGCLRLTVAEGQWLMAHIPLGTPTVISS